MTRAQLLQFLRRHRLCVQASVSAAGTPQAAVVGYAASDDLEIVFDALVTTRKIQNLRRNPAISLVIGWDEDQTVQLEGIADEPESGSPEQARLKALYFATFPDGVERERWSGITYVRVTPRWIRYSDFRRGETAVEFTLDERERG